MDSLKRLFALASQVYFALGLLLILSAFGGNELAAKPLWSRIFGSGTHSEKIFTQLIAKLNTFENYAFIEAYRNETLRAFYSSKLGDICWLKRYDEDEVAGEVTDELVEFKTPVFRYGNLVGHCTAGDVTELADKTRAILIGLGEWRE